MKPFNSRAFDGGYVCAGASFPQRIKKEPNEPHFCGYEGKQNNFLAGFKLYGSGWNYPSTEIYLAGMLRVGVMVKMSRSWSGIVL